VPPVGERDGGVGTKTTRAVEAYGLGRHPYPYRGAIDRTGLRRASKPRGSRRKTRGRGNESDPFAGSQGLRLTFTN
jgi:hypothetical protein